MWLVVPMLVVVVVAVAVLKGEIKERKRILLRRRNGTRGSGVRDGTSGTSSSRHISIMTAHSTTLRFGSLKGFHTLMTTILHRTLIPEADAFAEWSVSHSDAEDELRSTSVVGTSAAATAGADAAGCGLHPQKSPLWPCFPHLPHVGGSGQ